MASARIIEEDGSDDDIIIIESSPEFEEPPRSTATRMVAPPVKRPRTSRPKTEHGDSTVSMSWSMGSETGTQASRPVEKRKRSFAGDGFTTGALPLVPSGLRGGGGMERKKSGPTHWIPELDKSTSSTSTLNRPSTFANISRSFASTSATQLVAAPLASSSRGTKRAKTTTMGPIPSPPSLNFDPTPSPSRIYIHSSPSTILPPSNAIPSPSRQSLPPHPPLYSLPASSHLPSTSVPAALTPTSSPSKRSESPPSLPYSHYASFHSSPPSAPPPYRPPPPIRSARLRMDLYNRLESQDWELCDPRALPSVLFRIEYETHGNLDYKQAHKKPFRPSTRGKGRSVRLEGGEEVSWAGGDVRGLARRLDTPPFVAPVWIRDIIGGEGEGRMRKAVVSDVEMLLVGKDFPLRCVMVVGIVVGVMVWEEKKKVVYLVDDSTAIVQCECQFDRVGPIPGIDPYSTTKDRKELMAGIAAKKLDRPTLKEGTLVKVVGSVADGMFAGADQIISVEIIESLRDPNLESQHHIFVARLHNEVYSRPFDLTARLLTVEASEREAKAHSKWSGSQATASEAGTPKKLKTRHMTSPHLLPEDSITLSNFKVYIQFYIQRDYLTPLHSRATTPSPAKSCHPDDYNSVPKQDLPKPFTLDALETNKRLNIFAERLAQKLERTRLEGEGVRKRGVPLRENGSTDWVKPSVSGFRGSMSSWNTGSVTLLPGPTAKGGKRDVKEQGKREGGMKGEKLKGKVKGLFEKVLRLMREAGEIVLALDEVEEEEEKARFDPDDLFSLAAHGLSRPTSAVPMHLDDFDRKPNRLPMHLDDFDDHTPSLPIHLNDDDDRTTSLPIHLDDHDDHDDDPRFVHHRWHLDVSPPRRLPIHLDDMDDTPKASKPWHLDSTTYQRPPHSSHLSPTPSTPKATRISPIKVESPAWSPARSTSSIFSYTDDLPAPESYLFVTPYYLSLHILSLLEIERSKKPWTAPLTSKNSAKVSYKEKKREESAPRGISMARLRELMVVDPRWEEVGRSEMVGLAWEELVETNRVVSVGALIRPPMR